MQLGAPAPPSRFLSLFPLLFRSVLNYINFFSPRTNLHLVFKHALALRPTTSSGTIAFGVYIYGVSVGI